MEIATLPKALEGFFDSLVPALTQTMVLFAFVVFFFGLPPLTAWLKSHLARLKDADALANDPFIKESGLLKLVPIGLLVAVLLFAITLDRTVSFVGSKIPGQLSYSEPGVLVQAVPTEHLAKLWALFPAADDEHMLYLILEQQISTIPTPANAQTRLPWVSHDEQFFAAASLTASIKFYVVLGLLLCLARNPLGLKDRNVWLRYMVVIMGSAALGAFLVVQAIGAKEQSDWAKVNYIIAKQVAAGSESESRLKDKEAHAKFTGLLRAYRDRQKENNIHAFYPRP